MLWSELSGGDREAFSYELDAFEAALDRGDPRSIDEAFARLSQTVEALDGGERW